MLRNASLNRSVFLSPRWAGLTEKLVTIGFGLVWSLVVVHSARIMSSFSRYLIISVTAFLLILGPLAWAIQFKRAFRAQMAQRIRDHEVAQGNAAAARLSDDEVLQGGFGAELPPGVMTRLMICDVLLKFWWLWSLLVLTLCYGLFFLLGSFGSTPASGMTTSVSDSTT